MAGRSSHTSVSRRRLLQQAAALTGIAGIPVAIAQTNDEPLPLPNKDKLEAGDFLFPKEPGKYIPYSQVPGRTFEEERNDWERERLAMINALAQTPSDPYAQRLAAELQRMTFSQFYTHYMEATPDGEPTPYSIGSIAVGHVGIVDIDTTGARWIIEAMPAPREKSSPYPTAGVGRIRYDHWLSHRKGQLVWQARLRRHSHYERAKIAQHASDMKGRPFNILNFNLADTRDFFCSKLAWHATKAALDIAIDDNADPYRLIPLSPKQLLYSKLLTRLHEPGLYWNR